MERHTITLTGELDLEVEAVSEQEAIKIAAEVFKRKRPVDCLQGVELPRCSGNEAGAVKQVVGFRVERAKKCVP